VILSANLDDAFSTIFELEASLEEDQSLGKGKAISLKM